jgi:hypothetical protein
LSRVNGSVTPLRLATIKMTVSCVVNRRPHSGHDLRRRIAAPSSAVRLSMTLLSGCRQNGQCTRSPPQGCVLYQLYSVTQLLEKPQRCNY